MLHQPKPDNLPPTNELICALVNRFDTPNCLFALLALMTEVADELPVDRQFRMALTLFDAGELILERPAVRDWASGPHSDEGHSC
jgi:hypothetical protein